MGLCASKLPSASPEERANNRAINEQLNVAAESDKKVHKLLLLGPGDSGKSTLFKQMSISYGKGFSNKDRSQFRNVIYFNVNSSITTLCQNCERCGCLDQVDESVRELLKQYAEPGKKDQRLREEISDLMFMRTLSPERAEEIKMLWGQEGIKKTFEKRSMFQLSDTSRYFLDRLDKLAASDYLPDEDDILRCRAPTSGIIEIEFTINNADFRMFDVGGQRSERKKWINCFDGVTAVLFVASISEFDQVLYEDETKNRMEEALELFDEICNCAVFEQTNMILFLNKEDIFREKIEVQGIEFSEYFNYEGENTYEGVSTFVQDMFLSRNGLEKDVYVHITCATDTQQVKVVFAAVRNIVIKSMLDDVGLL